MHTNPPQLKQKIQVSYAEAASPTPGQTSKKAKNPMSASVNPNLPMMQETEIESWLQKFVACKLEKVKITLEEKINKTIETKLMEVVNHTIKSMNTIVARINKTILNVINVHLHQVTAGLLQPNPGIVNHAIPPVTPPTTLALLAANADKENNPNLNNGLTDQSALKRLLADVSQMTE